MSDEEYAKFLEKADNDASAASKTSSKGKKGGFTTNSVDAKVPAVLEKVDRYYVSDSDERFEVVSLSLSGSGGGGGNVGVGVFKQVSGHGNAETLDVKEFDPQGEYKDVVDAVKEAGNGKVEVFRADLGGARCEYWLISIDDKGNRVVGFRVGAVES